MKKIILGLSFVFFLLQSGCGTDHMPVLNDGGGASFRGGVTYLNEIRAIFQSNCSSCHGPGSPRGNWLNYDEAFAQRALIFRRVVELKDMPPVAGALSEEDRGQIALWIRGGAIRGDAGNPSPTPPTPSPTPPTPSPTPPAPSPAPAPSPTPPAPSPAPAPVGGLNYVQDIRPLFQNRCATCHNEGSSVGNWMVYAEAFQKRDAIYQRVVVNQDMPLGGTLLDSERSLIERWIRSGAPETGDASPSPQPSPNHPPANSVNALLRRCLACHAGGAVSNPRIPFNFGQDERYLYSQLKRFRNGRRLDDVTGGEMNRLLRGRSDRTLRNLAKYFSQANPCEFERSRKNAGNGNVARGRRVVREMRCAECHAAGGFNAPTLEGQNTQYLIDQMNAFKLGRRHDTFMNGIARSFGGRHIEDVSAYYNSLNLCGAE